MKFLSRITPLLFVLLIGFLFSGCSKVPAGHEGVKVELYGSDQGVSASYLGVGRHWIGVNEELYVFPVFEQNYTYTQSLNEGEKVDQSITFQNGQGQSFNVDIGVRLQVMEGESVNLFQQYQKQLRGVILGPMRNSIRKALNRTASTMTVEEIVGEGRARLMDSVKEYLVQQFEPYGIRVIDVMQASDFRLPRKIRDAIDAKIAATQRAEQREYELREAIAQARKDSVNAASNARVKVMAAQAEAQANREIARSITPTLVRYEAAKRWDGKQPQVVGSSGQLLFQVDR